MIKKGFYWHVHHDKLIEWCYDYKERADYIKEDKPKNEIKTRLRLFKKVKGKLPKEFVEAGKKCDEAWKKYDEAVNKCVEAVNKCVEAVNKCDEAWKKYDEAWKKYDEAWKKYKLQLEKLHKKECGCREWNGEELCLMQEIN